MRAIERGRTAGTRGGVGRLAAMVVGLALVLLLGLVGEARAGTYRVVQCGWGVGAELDPAFATTEGTAFSFNAAPCAPPLGAGPAGMQFEAGLAPDGVVGLARARWVAPPGTGFTAVHLIWSGTLQPGNWRGLAADVGAQSRLLASDWFGGAAAAVDAGMPGPAWAFEAVLQCVLVAPIGCTRSAPSTMRLSGVVLAIEDPVPPTAQLGGPLLAPGWHRGTAVLELGSGDAGAGVAGEAATIDGAAVLSDAPVCAELSIEGEWRGTKLRPCPPTDARTVEVDTTRLADGTHAVRGCATDFSGGQGCAPEAEVEVDNSAPAVAFTSASPGRVAATASDPYSGPASGTLSIRPADAGAWIDLPTEFDPGGGGTATLTAPLPELAAGTYFFRATAADVAGNAATAQLRVSGSAAEVREQAAAGSTGAAEGREAGTAGGKGGAAGQGSSGIDARHASRHPTHLAARLLAGRRSGAGATSSLTVDYGTAVEVRGWLTDARGGGIDGRPVAVVVRSAAGIGGAPERLRALTDHDGRFGLRLPAGTSRRVSVSFHGGGGLAPAPRRSLALRVRASVSLAAEPTALDTGESVRLHGRVLLGPARVSRRGKLVAIQYLERATGRWRPALVVRTDAKGRFDTKYRFRYVTGLAEIRLRATAPAEGGWPFARGSSAPVTVTVHGR